MTRDAPSTLLRHWLIDIGAAHATLARRWPGTVHEAITVERITKLVAEDSPDRIVIHRLDLRADLYILDANGGYKASHTVFDPLSAGRTPIYWEPVEWDE